MNPSISVYIPCHNYGRYLRDAVRSVLTQTFSDWELLIVDDGSTDETEQVLGDFVRDPRVWGYRNEEPKGLRAVANMCFEQARGEYVLRLDADDFLHPRALELLLEETKTPPPAALVFSDYFYVDARGRVTGVEALPTLDGRYQAASFPPHGAGSLVERRVVQRFGGFDESLRRQDGHELWIRLLDAGGVIRHVALPLFYYRQHGPSLSRDRGALLADRASIKRNLARGRRVPTRVVGVLTVCNTNPELPDIPFVPFGGSNLLHCALAEASLVEELHELAVSTDDTRVGEYVAAHFPAIRVIQRPPQLRHHDANMRDILADFAQRLSLSAEDVLCVLNLHTPFRRARHIYDALDNFKIYDVDSIVSVYEEQNLVYQLGPYGLEPINPGRHYLLRRERETVYIENSAVRVFAVGNLRYPQFLGQRIGHVLMEPQEAFKINSMHEVKRLEDLEPSLLQPPGGA